MRKVFGILSITTAILAVGFSVFSQPEEQLHGAAKAQAIPKRADLVLTQNVPAAITRPATGKTLMNYVFTVTNKGNTQALNAQFMTVFSPYVKVESATGATCSVYASIVFCKLGNVDVSASKTITLSISVPSIATKCKPLTITSTPMVWSSTLDVSTANNQLQTKTIINCAGSSSSASSSLVSSSVSSSVSSVESSSSSIQSSSVATSSSSSEQTLPELSVTVKNIGSANTAVSNQKDVNLLRFEAHPVTLKNIRVNGLKLIAQAGTLANGTQYSLWVDTDGNSVVDTVLQSQGMVVNNVLTFDLTSAGGFVARGIRTTIFEVHADISTSLSSNKVIQLQFATNEPDYIKAEFEEDSSSLTGIRTNNVCSGSCQIQVLTVNSMTWNLVNNGSLYVTKDSTPVRARQLLGGALSDAIMSVQFRAENEEIDVTHLQFTSIGNVASSVDRLELFKAGETTPFATATVAGCGTEQILAVYNSIPVRAFCANMQNRELVVPKGQEIDINVRARIKTDTNGAISGESIEFFLYSSGHSNGTTAYNSVRARGGVSGRNLAQNDGDTTAEGEMFIGTSTPTYNSHVFFNKNVVVLSKIMSIVNANPDADDTNVPTGVRPIGQFRFTAAANSNSQYGNNKATLSGVIFNINATNVRLGSGDQTVSATSDFYFYNKADSMTKHKCLASVADATGSFYVTCRNLQISSVDTAIDAAASVTFVLEAEVSNPQISSSSNSTLAVSLMDFTNIAANSFSGSSSHIHWVDNDAASHTPFYWIEYPDNIVNSTTYRN